MRGIIEQLQAALGPGGVLTGDDAHNRAGGWGVAKCDALCVVRPTSTEEVATVLRICHASGQPVVTEGGKTGLVSGARAAAPPSAATSPPMPAATA